MSQYLSGASCVIDWGMDPNKLVEDRKRDIQRQQYIKEWVATNKLILLEDDYRGTDSYYFNPVTKAMYKVDNVCGDPRLDSVVPRFELTYDQRVMQQNEQLLKQYM